MFSYKCDVSGIGTGSYFKEGIMLSGGICQGVAEHPGYGLPEHSHA